MTDIFRGVGVEIELAKPDDFLKVKETLTRIGIASRKENTLYQSCHILHKQGRYAIMHFKEMFILDGKENTLTSEDVARRNTIVDLLEQWGLLKIISYMGDEEKADISQIKIIAFKEKQKWRCVEKYRIGNKK